LWIIADSKIFDLQVHFPQALSTDIRGHNNAKENQAPSHCFRHAPTFGMSYL